MIDQDRTYISSCHMGSVTCQRRHNGLTYIAYGMGEKRTHACVVVPLLPQICNALERTTNDTRATVVCGTHVEDDIRSTATRVLACMEWDAHAPFHEADEILTKKICNEPKRVSRRKPRS